MTDRGTRVRWTTAALVAPAAAALFTGTTVWASAHQPSTASTTASTTATAAKAPEKTVDPLVESLRAAVDANTEQVLTLRDTVATLQKQAAAIAKGAKVPVVKAVSSSRSSTTRRSTTRSSSTGSHTSAPATSTAKAPVATSGGS
jgi:hypothetical protein